MKKYYIVNLTAIVKADLATMDRNAGFPNKFAERWAIDMPTAREGYSYAEAPVNGYGDKTGEEMMKDVVSIPVDAVNLPIYNND